VIDLYSVKPVDVETLREAAEVTRRMVVVEDHWPEGGLGDAVMEAFADGWAAPRVIRLAVRDMPGSATPQEQLAVAGIDADAIVAAAHDMVDLAALP
jgi:transketolase